MEPIPIQEIGKRTGRSTADVQHGSGFGLSGDPMFTLQSSAQHGIGEPLGFDRAQITSDKNYSNPKPGDPQPPLNTAGQGMVATPAIAFSVRGREGGAQAEVEPNGIAPVLRNSAGGGGQHTFVNAPTLTAANDPSRSPQSEEVTRQVEAVHAATMRVRRLTPRECERLQGFPDDFTMIPLSKGRRRKVEADFAAYIRLEYPDATDEWIAAQSRDGPRYRALGNSMAVPVMAWIGRRIQAVQELTP